jgi:hypothetical protein
MSEETFNKPKTKVWGGVFFLFIYYIIALMFIKSFIEKSPSEDFLQQGIGVTAIVSMIIYAAVAKRFHFERKKKLILIGVLFVVVNIGGVYLGRYYYWISPSMTEVNRVVNGISILKPQEKLQEVNKLGETISGLSESIQTKPTNIAQVKQYVDVIDRLFSLHKKNYELVRHVHEQMLELFFSVKTEQDREKVEDILRHNGGLNISVLAVLRKQHDKWYEALTANLTARKEYYESVINRESSQTQDYLLRKWATLEKVYLQEESKLIEIQAELKAKPKGSKGSLL